MPTSLSFAARAAGAVAGLLALTSVAAQAESNCDWYAQTALKQQQQNDKLKCGLTGPAWTTDLKAHLAWCGSVAPDKMKTEAQAREQQLQACAAKTKK